jgi:FKBP-type peptidyl-prolyl cis-trans isomerase
MTNLARNASAAAATLLSATMMLAVGCHAQTSTNSNANSALTDQKAKQSYAIGMSVGKSLKREEIDVDPELVMRGIKDQISGATPLLTDQEAQATLTTMQQASRAKMEAKMKAEGEANKKEGDEFLAANKTKDGVKTLPDGLQYKVITQGTGPKPVLSDSVECNYRGTLLSGKEFDSSYKRGQPATFPVGGVIKGWTEILQQMPVGSKYQIWVPAELAYGARQQGPDIGPNATLVFEIELLSIKPKPEAAKPAPAAAPKPATPATPAKK